MTKLIILDRDGVINEDRDDFVKSPEEWIAIPGSLEAIAQLNQAGYQVVVATNQSGVARELFTLGVLGAIHEKMQKLLSVAGGEIAHIYFCPHGPDDGCDCRKPKAGLFQQIANDYEGDLAGVPAVGDSLRDIQASQVLGCQPYLVRTGKGERTLAASKEALQNVPIFNSLLDVVHHLLAP